MQGRGCPKCGRKIVNTETYIALCKQKFGNQYSYDNTVYINRKTKITITCPKHGDFEILPGRFLNEKPKTHCPICANSLNKKETQLFESIQKTFPNEKIVRCYRNKKILERLEIDIYFPKHKIGIEYQGDQHFHPIPIFGGEETFEKQLERDNKKIEICQNNNIKLYHFTYNKENVTDYKLYNNEQELIDIIKKQMREV